MGKKLREGLPNLNATPNHTVDGIVAPAAHANDLDFGATHSHHHSPPDAAPLPPPRALLRHQPSVPEKPALIQSAIAVRPHAPALPPRLAHPRAHQIHRLRARHRARARTQPRHGTHHGTLAPTSTTQFRNTHSSQMQQEMSQKTAAPGAQTPAPCFRGPGPEPAPVSALSVPRSAFTVLLEESTLGLSSFRSLLARQWMRRLCSRAPVGRNVPGKLLGLWMESEIATISYYSYSDCSGISLVCCISVGL